MGEQKKIFNQITSKRRVTDHGEVFTSNREVNAMLDLVKQETKRIESRFLEPACGTGNFLIEILNRKLAVVESEYAKSQIEFERYAVIAISSIYGIDILKDNIKECRKRLYNVFNKKYITLFKNKCKEECKKTVIYILDRNILWGDALSLKTPNQKSELIVFSEWSAFNKGMIKRRDYTMKNLLENQPIDDLNLFSDLGDKAFIPTPVQDYPLIHFLKLDKNETNQL